MTTPAQPEAIEALLKEARRFPPPAAFAAQANAKPGIYEDAARIPKRGGPSWARKLTWMKPFTKGLEWNEPFAKWFADGELNASVNALDRHVQNGLASRVAYYYEGEPGDRWSVTYGELLDQVCRFANGLRALGIKKGDRVAIYMPMIMELPVAMLAVRAHRCGALGDLRRLRARCDRRSRERFGMRRTDHGRSRLAPRQESAAQSELRRSDREGHALTQARDRGEARRRSGRDGCRPRPLVRRRLQGSAIDVSARSA